MKLIPQKTVLTPNGTLLLERSQGCRTTARITRTMVATDQPRNSRVRCVIMAKAANRKKEYDTG